MMFIYKKELFVNGEILALKHVEYVPCRGFKEEDSIYSSNDPPL